MHRVKLRTPDGDFIVGPLEEAPAVQDVKFALDADGRLEIIDYGNTQVDYEHSRPVYRNGLPLYQADSGKLYTLEELTVVDALTGKELPKPKVRPDLAADTHTVVVHVENGFVQDAYGSEEINVIVVDSDISDEEGVTVLQPTPIAVMDPDLRHRVVVGTTDILTLQQLQSLASEILAGVGTTEDVKPYSPVVVEVDGERKELSELYYDPSGQVVMTLL